MSDLTARVHPTGRAPPTHERTRSIGEYGKPAPLFIARKKECHTMRTIESADGSTAVTPISHTNAPVSPMTDPQPKAIAVIGDITIDDEVAMRPEWTRLWRRLLAPRRDDAA